jgi:predicted DNA-binding transcriptional regulator YafY
MSRHHLDQSKINRQNQVKRYLSQTSEESALSITEITERLIQDGFSINRKSVERDIEDISIAHPLSETSSNPKRFYFDGEFKLDFELIFDEKQLQTIVMALETLKQISPKVIKNQCQNVEITLLSKLPKALAKEFEHLKSISSTSPTILGEGGDIDSEVFETVLYCLRKGKAFRCEYYSADESKHSKRERLFAPLKLHLVGAPYLYVYDCENNQIKILRISRIQNAVKTDKLVDPKRAKEIKLDHVFGAFGKGDEKVINYAITCTKPMALKFREQKIHPSQKIEVLEENLFVITFSVHDSDEVVRLLSQYGEFIKEITPETAYEKVKTIWAKGLKGAA